ncbi:MAG: hypothetical protein JXA89_27540 [Anaerolineae bacterium]|nr:hypothetical protein [Anaerolineae bacterium]
MVSMEQKQSSQSDDLAGVSGVRRAGWIGRGDMTYLFASLFLRGMQLLNPSQRQWGIDKLSIFLGQLLYTTNAHVTRTVRENMNAILGFARSSDALEKEVRQLLSLTIWNALVINSLPVLSQDRVAELISIEGASLLEGDQDERPLLIWGYHFGIQPLIIAAVLHARGYPIHAVTHVNQMPAAASAFQRRYLQRLERIGHHFSVIDPREGAQRKMLDVLRNGECLYVTPDYMIKPDEPQFHSPFTVPVDLIGKRAFLQTGALRLAKRLNARVVTVLTTQKEGGERSLRVEPFELPTSGLKPSELQCDLQMCMRRLESHVMAHPGLWWDVKRNDLLERLTTISKTE